MRHKYQNVNSFLFVDTYTKRISVGETVDNYIHSTKKNTFMSSIL